MIGMMTNILTATIWMFAAHGDRQDVALVEAELKNVHYESEIEGNGGDVVVGAWFSARIKIKAKLIGDLPDSTRTVKIVMTSLPLPSLYRGRKVYLLIKEVKEQKPIVLAWDYVDTGLCISRKMAERYSIEGKVAKLAGSPAIGISSECSDELVPM